MERQIIAVLRRTLPFAFGAAPLQTVVPGLLSRLLVARSWIRSRRWLSLHVVAEAEELWLGICCLRWSCGAIPPLRQLSTARRTSSGTPRLKGRVPRCSVLAAIRPRQRRPWAYTHGELDFEVGFYFAKRHCR